MAHRAKWIKASPDEPVVDVAKRTLKLRLEMVAHILPYAARKWQEDNEHVHLLRVSARRAQAALSMYWQLLPVWRVSWMDEQMKHLRRATNNARDDDVFIRRLSKEKKREAVTGLLDIVREHRRKSQKPLMVVFEKLDKDNRLARKIAKLVKRVRLRGKYKEADEPPTFGDWAPNHFANVLDRFFDAAQFNDKDLESMHQFRIAGKSVRYAMELLAGAFEPEFRKDVYSALEKLQEKLGRLNDHVAARSRILKWIGETDSASAELEYLHELLAYEKQEITRSSAEFFEWWTPRREAKLRERFDHCLKSRTSELCDVD